MRKIEIMAKSYCVNFPFCSPLARRFGVNQQILNIFINLYNRNVAPEERILPDKEYTAEELNEIYDKISAQRSEKAKDKRYNSDERNMLIRTYGGPEALAFKEVTETFDAEETENLMQELGGAVVDLLVQYSQRHNCTVEDYVKAIGTDGINSLFNIVTKRYAAKLHEATGVLSGAEPVASSNIQTAEQAERVRGLITKLFQPGRAAGRVFDSMKILSLSVINKALGVRIHGDFSLETDGGITYELADSIKDMEEPVQERYMQALDAQGLEDSLSAIVSRVLMQMPKKRTVVSTDITEVNGQEVVNTTTTTEQVISPVLGQPLYSDPQILARRLANVLANVTGEQEMLDTLQGAGYTELYAVLAADSGLRTTFFQEFNRYAQTYRAIELTRQADGTVKANVQTLGRSKSEGLVSFQNRLDLGNISSNSIFELNKDGKPQFKRFTYVSGIANWFDRTFYATKDGVKSTNDSVFEKASPSMKESHLASLMEFMNIPVTEKGIGILLSDPSKLHSFLEAASSFFATTDGLLGKDYSGVSRNLRGKFFNNKDISSAISTMMAIVEATPRNFYGSRVTYEGSSLSTMIMNSPLSIFAKKVNGLYDRVVGGKVSRDFTNFLMAKYLHSPQYMTGDGRILNRWLRDFVACADEAFEPCAKSIFGFSRDLGIDHVKTEDISDQQHMLLMLQGYLGGRSYATTRDQLVGSEEEAQKLSTTDGKRYVVSGTPFYYQRGKRWYRKDVAHIPSFITGDTNAVRQIRTIHYYEEEVLDGMCDLFVADKVNQGIINYFNDRGVVFSANGKEAFTSRQVKVDGKKTRRSNADKFGILQFLNQTISNAALEELGLSVEKGKSNPTWYEAFIMKAAQKMGLNPAALTKEERIALEADRQTFKEVASVYMNAGFAKFKAQLENLGLLEKTSEGKYVYFDSMLSESGDKEAQLDEKLRDFYYDYKFGQYNQAHLTQVNPLFLNGVEEHQKRNKGTLTNGSPLSMEAVDSEGNSLWGYDPETGTYDFTSKVMYFKDVKAAIDGQSREVLLNYFTKVFARTSKSLDEAARRAKEHVSKLDSNSLTDGQAYRTLESYRKVLMSAGKQFWTDGHQRAYDQIMDIVMPIREARRRGERATLSAEDIQKIEDLMAVMQPIKPINDGQEIIKTDLGFINIPFQFKYAEVPIVPELLPEGCKLRELGDMMVDKGIDMIASDKCLKKGSYGEMDLQYKMVKGKYVDAKGEVLPGMDANGNIIDDGTQTAAQQRANPNNAKKFVEWEKGTSVKDIFDAHSVDGIEPGYTVHSISMENYLLQSNIPDHTDGNSIMGTQPRKIGTGAIVNSESYQYTIGPSGAKISGKKLARLYGAAHAVKYAKSYSKFTDRIDDTSSMVEDLIYNMINNGRSNLAAISRLTLVDGVNPTVPFSEPSTAKDVQRNLISIFKKSVIRQMISGGSLVQASSLGYGKEALADTGLKAVIEDGVPIAMQTEMPFNFHYVDESGTMQFLRYEDYCDENGYFLDENGEAITEDRYGTVKAQIEIDFPGILDLVAYRIPTEMEYSMFHLRIVKCNPKSTNNTIKLPAECTTIAGFDFDIDKLYLMRHNYKTSQPVSEYDVWTEFYERNPHIANLLREAWEEDGKPKERPLHSYWSTVMDQHKSLMDEFPNKEKAYQDVKADMQKGMVDRTPIDYEMDPEKLADLSQSELDNLLVDCMISILSDESTVGDRYSIGGFEQASEDAKLMRLLTAGMWSGEEGTFSDFADSVADMEDIKEEFDYSEPMTSVIFKEQNQIAGTLIGIFANDNVNAFISKGLKTFKITSPKDRILFGSLLQGVTELDGSIDDLDSSDIGLSFKHTSVNGKEIKKTLAELLAASVDAVKDPVLNYLNLNSITADAAAMLARLGYTTRDIGLLFNQPVIKQMCLYMDRSGETNVRRALVKVLGDMGSTNPMGLFGAKASMDTSGLTQEALARGLNPNSVPDLRMQETVAQLFNSIMLTKSEFSSYIQDTRNTSANTVKSRFEDYQSSADKSGRQFERITIETNDEIGYPITDDITEEMLTTPEGIKQIISKYKDHPFLYENVVAAIINRGMQHMMDKYTLYTTPLYGAYRGTLRSLIAPWGLSGDQIETLYSDIPVMMMSSMDGDFNPTHMSDGETPNAIKYVDEEYFFKDLQTFLENHPELNKLPIIDALDIDARLKVPRLTLKYSRSITPIEKLAFTLSWHYLMMQGGDAAEMGKALYLHFYYTRGLNPETNVAMELAPVSVLKALKVDAEAGTSYVDFFDKATDFYSEDATTPDKAREIKKNLYQFLLSHNSDTKLVRPVSIKLEDCKSPGSEEIVFRKPRGAQLTDVRNSLDLVRLQTVRSGGRTVGAYYAPVIKVEGRTYVLALADGSIDYENFKSSSTETIRYIPASLIDMSSMVLYEKLSGYYTEQNSLIFKSIPEAVSLSKVINSEDITTDTSTNESSTNEAYDDAKEETKDDEVESSDGRPKCHTH